MKKLLITLTYAFALTIALPSATVDQFSGVASAAQTDEKKKKARRIPTMSESTFKRLGKAQELIDLKDLSGAIAELKAMLDRPKKYNQNEIGQVHNMLGFIYFTKEEYSTAIKHYEIVVAQGEKIPEGLEVTTIYTLAQLYAVDEKFKRALDYMKLWLTKANNPGADPYIFMGQLMYQDKNFPKAIDYIEQGMGVARERSLPMKENWWSLLNYLYYEQENWGKVLEILETLVADFPKRQYWVQLAGIHGQQGHDKEQVYTMEAAYTADMLEGEKDLMNMAGLLMQEEVPYRAAKVLAAGFKAEKIERSAKNLQALGQAWQLSSETDKAIPVLEEAGKKSDDGKIFERLSQLYLDKDQYAKCEAAANKALDKGGLRKKQNAMIVKGMCQFNAGKLKSARSSFVSCRTESRVTETRKGNKADLRLCQQWITYIDRETERIALLKASG